MDKMHHDFFELLDALASISDQDFPAAFRTLVSVAEQVFRLEEQWLEGVDIQTMQTQQEQYARVLGALHNVHFRVMNGELGLGREVVEELFPQWLTHHMLALHEISVATPQMGTHPIPDFEINIDDLHPCATRH
jgi:hemerythrin